LEWRVTQCSRAILIDEMNAEGRAASPEVSADAVTKRRLAFVGASAATVLGAFGLLGWITPWRELSSLISGSIPMAPTTAVMLVLLGGALMLESSRRSVGRSLGSLTAVSCLVTAFAAAELLTFFAALPPTLDALLVPFPDSFGNVPTGRMSPLTALGLLLAGLSLLAIRLARGRRFVAAGAAILAIAAFALLTQQAGTVAGWLAGLPRTDLAAIAIETNIRNTNLALLLKASLFPAVPGVADPLGDGVLFASLMYGAAAAPLAIPLILVHRRLARREGPGGSGVGAR